MDTNLTQSLEDVGYLGYLLDEKKLNKALKKGAKSPDFTGLVAWFAEQFVIFENIEESIHPTTSPDDSSTFLLELSSFLKELGCINSQLTCGNVNQRLSTIDHRIMLIEYLIMELMSCKINYVKKRNITSKNNVINESDTAKCLKSILTTLEISKPPDTITSLQLFKKIEDKLVVILKSVPKDLLGSPLIIGELSKKQWDDLDKIHKQMIKEYKTRKEMLLKRLDVTFKSFLWSDRLKSKENQLNSCYYEKREKMSIEPNVKISNLLSSRDDLAIIEKTSNASVTKNTRNDVRNVIIGDVPDRGGRPREVEAPPPEMPSWQKDRQPGAPRGGGRGARGGGSGEGRGRGGYQNRKDATANFGQNIDSFDNKQASYDQPNYDNRGGDYDRRGRGGRGGSGGGGGGYHRGRGGRVQGGWAQGGGYNRGGNRN